MNLLRITESPRRSSIFAGLLVVATAACGRKASRHDAAPIAKDARDPSSECATLFDRFHATLVEPLAQIGLHETPEAARARDAAGLARCAALPEPARTCLLATKVGPSAWSACGVEPPFTLFDATSAHEALLGAPVKPPDFPPRVAALAGTWVQSPKQPLDDTVTWTIGPTGSLAVRRTNKTAKKPQDEPVKQLSFARERLLAVTLKTATQLAPFVRIGDSLYMSWTSGAMAIPVPDDRAFALDVADRARWILWRSPACTLLDPRRGASPATCAWEDAAGTRTFVVKAESLEQRWTLREGFLLHPKLETFTKR